MNLVECRNCGAVHWTASDVEGLIDAGPCCRGYPILTLDQYPNEKAAAAAYPDLVKAREASISARICELEKS